MFIEYNFLMLYLSDIEKYIMGVYLQNSPADEPVYQFMDKKRSEGKPYKVYMMASANKFLRIYYATVKAYLDNLDAV